MRGQDAPGKPATVTQVTNPRIGRGVPCSFVDRNADLPMNYMEGNHLSLEEYDGESVYFDCCAQR